MITKSGSHDTNTTETPDGWGWTCTCGGHSTETFQHEYQALNDMAVDSKHHDAPAHAEAPPTLTVGKAEEDGPWAILLNGTTVAAARSHFDAHEVLLIAETYVDSDVLWRLTDDGGFEAVLVP